MYAYRVDDLGWLRGAVAETGSSVPVTGWLHAGGGPPWRVIVAASRNTLDAFPIKGTHVAPYTGDEPTVDIAEWTAAVAHRV